jgi:hypothetical protein
MRARNWIILGILIILVIALTIDQLTGGGFYHRLVLDFWPIDYSRVGPNLVASAVQWFIVGLVAAVIYPPFRHWIESQFDGVHEKIDKHHQEHLQKIEERHQQHLDLMKEHHEKQMEQLKKNNET